MKWPDIQFFCRIIIGVFFLGPVLPLFAGIYFWTDENGVRHYSNVAPSETGRDIQQLDEIPPSAQESPVPADMGAGVSEPAASGQAAPAEASSPASQGSEPAASGQTAPAEASSPAGQGSEPAASGQTAPAEASSPASQETGQETATEGGSESEAAQSPPPVPTRQDEIVQGEKAAVRNLQRQLGDDASRRDEFIEKERKRLAGALEQLQKTPISKFGSQKNKTRAMGYYKYRLEALENSPDSYFQYGDSDID